jgi:DNA-binding NtrC family response regulator
MRRIDHSSGYMCAVDDTTTLSGFSDPADARALALRPQPQLFVVIECERLAAGGSRHSLASIDTVVIGRGREHAAVREIAGQGADARSTLKLTLADRRMSSAHVRITRVSYHSFAIEDLGSKNGTSLNGTLINQRVLLGDGDVIEAGATFLLFRAAALSSDAEPIDVTSQALTPPAPGMATLHSGLAHSFSQLARVAAVDGAICILGATGTGKEVIARAVHQLSRRPGPFVPVNCGALPGGLVESELYGHKRGAFSGADKDRIGMVQSANGGTLFLDEVGDLPLASQASLLRFLQQREVTPLGGRKPEPVDVRVISATNQDIPALVEKGKFRADLWARLSGFVTRLPALRARREDLGLLLASLCDKLAPERMSELALERPSARALMAHTWPLNVRELENVVRTSLALSPTAELVLRDLAEPQAAGGPGGRTVDTYAPTPVPAPPGAPAGAITDQPAEARRESIEEALRQHRGNVAAAARQLGCSRGALHRWIKDLGIDADRHR